MKIFPDSPRIDLNANPHLVLDTREAARVIGCSVQWLEIDRSVHGKGEGPPYIRIGNRVKYCGADLLKWLENRPRYNSVTQYKTEAA